MRGLGGVLAEWTEGAQQSSQEREGIGGAEREEGEESVGGEKL